MSSKHPRASTLLAAALLACLAACGETTDCEDGTDNDGDGLIDGADLACQTTGEAEAPDPVVPECSDALDNDEDGLTDDQDPGCANPQDNAEQNEPIAACNDGIDNDDDGAVDFPNDPGCGLSLDNDESDACPEDMSCPECGNGIDDDGDGEIDFGADVGCDSAGDTNEFNPVPGPCGAAPLHDLPEDGAATGDIVASGINALQTTACFAGGGAEVVYQFEVAAPTAAVFTTEFAETTADTVLYLRTTCLDPATELVCNDDADGMSVASRLEVAELAAGTWFLVVDGHDVTSEGAFKVQATFGGATPDP